MGFPGGSEGKASACNAGDLGLIPRWGRSPGEGNGNPLQYPCLKNAMDEEAWWATVHEVAKSQTQLSDFTFTFTLEGGGNGGVRVLMQVGGPKEGEMMSQSKDQLHSHKGRL